ncbi:MAG: hypothetical protein MUF25_29215 [Pirellulaceae bacterium]|nr:hypothetical protein [Pirellulaceae bacterium]
MTKTRPSAIVTDASTHRDPTGFGAGRLNGAKPKNCCRVASGRLTYWKPHSSERIVTSTATTAPADVGQTTTPPS